MTFTTNQGTAIFYSVCYNSVQLVIWNIKMLYRRCRRSMLPLSGHVLQHCQYIRLHEKNSRMINQQASGKKWSWLIEVLTQLEGVKKARKNLHQISCCPDHNSNQANSKHKPRTLTLPLNQLCSVQGFL